MIKKIIYTIIAFLCFSACNNNRLLPELIENNTYGELGIQTKSSSYQIDTFDIANYPYTMEEDSLFLETILGKIRSIVDHHEYYVVNEEFIYFKEELLERPIGNSSRLYGTLLDESCQYIYLSIHNGTDNNYISYDNDLIIFKEAVAEWNNLENCNIFFALSDDENYMGNQRGWFEVNVYIDDVVEFNNNQIHYFAEDGMNYLWGGTQNDIPFLNIWFNVSNVTYKEFNDETKKYSMMHALGHLVRLKDAELKMNHISETNQYDIFSIMHSYSYISEYGMTWSGFSDIDKEDLARVYPLLADDISFAIEPSVSNNRFYENVSYKIIPTYTAVKPFSQTEYVVEIDTGSNNYDLQVNQDGSVDVVFYSQCNVNIKVDLYVDDELKKSCEDNYSVVGENITIPVSHDEIIIGDSFSISWECGSGETVEFTGMELLFDYHSRNIIISSNNRGEATVTLNDYGSYVINMVKHYENGSEDKHRTIYIDKYYRPELYFPDYFGTLDVFDYRQKVFEIGRECPEDVSDITFTGKNPAYTITAGDSTELQARLCVRLYEKFYRDAFIPPYSVDRGPVTVQTGYVEKIYSKGSKNKIQLPPGRNGYIYVPEPGWLTYKGYYAVIIPEDLLLLR